MMIRSFALGLALLATAPAMAQILPPVQQPVVKPSAAASSVFLVNRTRAHVDFAIESPSTGKRTPVSLAPGIGATLALTTGDPSMRIVMDSNGKTYRYGLKAGESAHFVPKGKGVDLVMLTYQGASR